MRLRTAVLALFLGLASAGPIAAAVPAARTGALQAFEETIEATKEAMMGDPMVARKSAEQAVRIAEGLTKDRSVAARDAARALATANWLLGEALIGLNDADRARPLIEQALAAATRFDRGSKLHGDLLRSRATLSESAGDVQGALKDYLQAHQIFRAIRQTRSQAIALQDIGNLYLEAGDFERVRDYYSQSLEVHSKDPWLNLSSYNNRGQAYRDEGRFSEAEAEYKLALASARELQSPLLEARILTNLADSQAKAGKLRQASATIAMASRLVRSGEGVGWRPFVRGVQAEIEAKRGAFAEAARLLTVAFAGQKLDQTELPFRDLHKTAAAVYERLGNRDLALDHFKSYQRLNSDALRLTASASSQLMAARFDSANQNLRIAGLKQGQLERDILIERQRNQFRTNLFTGLGAALLVIFGLLSFGYVSIRRSRDRERVANAELSATNVALEKALKARTDFLATTSHEIRTPLNAILGMAQVLLAERRLAGNVRERIELLLGAGETMKTLVDDILDIAKMEAGELRIVRAETDLAKLLSDTAALWRNVAAGKGLAFECRIADVPERVLADEDQLRQILSNLLSNAIKFTNQGRVMLKARGSLVDGVDVVEFAVHDTGVGISTEDQAMIFEPFTQVNNSTTREFSGTGLGLAIAQRLASAHGGAITLSSVPGEGSCFTLSLALPRVGAAVASVELERSGRVERLADASVLLVERNPASHALLRMLLTPQTRSLDIALCAQDALERLRNEHFDHVVIEGASAGGATVAAIDEIRTIVDQAHAIGAKTSMLAAPTEALSTAQMFSVGANHVILKPIGASDLIASLKALYENDEPVGHLDPGASDRRAAG